jgi:PAS domain S-box-containing protein
MGPDPAGRDNATIVLGVTRDRRVSLWSPGAEQLYGIDTADALGAPILELANWRITAAEVEMCHLLRPGDVCVFGSELTTRDGRAVRLKTTATAAIDADGREELLFVSTEARPDAAPHSGAIQHVGALTGSQVSTGLCNQRMVLEYASPSIQSVFGYAARDVVGRVSIDTVHPDDRQLWTDAWVAAVADPARTESIEVRRLTASGEWRLMATDLTSMLDYPDVAGVVVTARDITDVRAQAKALDAVDQTLRSLLQNSLEGVWVIDRAGRTVFGNARVAALLGVSRFAMADYDLGDLIGATEPALGDHAAAGTRTSYEVPLVRPDGSRRWLALNVIPKFEPTGHYSGAIVLCADITDQRADEPSDPLGFNPAEPLSLADDGPTSTAIAELMNSLSSREAVIVNRLLDGDRVPDIARALFVSQSTVRNQLSAVFRKTHVASQPELIRLLRPLRRRAGGMPESG